MGFLFDEGAGAKKIKERLRERGHNVKAMNEGGLSGTDDSRVLEILREENRFLITCDTDFLKYRNTNLFGAILVEGDYKVTSELAERMVWTIEYITQNPDILDDLIVLERDTPYGSWKMCPQGDKKVKTSLSHFVNQLFITSEGKLTSTPISGANTEDKNRE